MLCYPLMVFHFHRPFKVYVKECQSNKVWDTSSTKCMSVQVHGRASTEASFFFFFFPPFPKSDWSDQKYHQHQHWSLHPLHCHKEKCPRDKCFDVWGSVRRSDFTGGFTCIGLSRQLNNRSDFQTTIPAQWWTLTPWPEHLFHTTTKESVKNLAVNLLTQMKR